MRDHISREGAAFSDTTSEQGFVAPSGSVDPGALRFRLAVQRRRGFIYFVAGFLALVAVQLRALEVASVTITGISGIAVLSSLATHVYFGRRTNPRWDRVADALWMSEDIALITVSVAVTGGAASPWFVWYVATLSAPAFLFGQRAVLLVTTGNIVAYLGVLWWAGDIRGFDDTLLSPLVRIVFLHAATIFLLFGVIDLNAKRLLIKRLMEEESRKVRELHRLSAALDDRTRELAVEHEKSQEANQLKSRFLASMSHELRTPLNAIIGFSDILLNREDVPAEKQRRFIRNVNDSGKHLLGLINDLLDLSKIEAGQMELSPEPFFVDSAIGGVVSIARGASEGRRVGIVVDVSEGLQLDADLVRFKQILYNLLSNAVKFSPAGSTVEIAARRVRAADSPLNEDSIEVSVRDYGIGIRPEDQRLVFEEFRQAGDGATRHQGTGLGLALVKRFVEQHQGVVGLVSAPGEGSTFTATLPLHFRGQSSRAAAVSRKLDRRRCVVVVEDDLASYEALGGPLAAAGYLPVRAGHGEEALDLIRRLRPIAITLDLGLPGLSGWQVLKAIKGDPAVSRIPVVIVSMSESRELGLALGADDYFLKPVDASLLVERLGKLTPMKSSPPSVLLIDDDPRISWMLEEVLTAAGYTMLYAQSGEEGVAKAIVERPALILLDLMMQGMDGFSVAGALRRDERTSSTPIVILTARELSFHDSEVLRGKVSALVTKGNVTHGQLVETIEALLDRTGERESSDPGPSA